MNNIPTDIVEILNDIIAHKELENELIIEKDNFERMYITDVAEIRYEDKKDYDVKIEIII